jgi:hypothetical protein
MVTSASHAGTPNATVKPDLRLHRPRSLELASRRGRGDRLSEGCDRERSGVIYKCAAPTMREVPRCPKTSAADTGGSSGGHSIATEHTGAPDLRQ